MKGIVAIVLVMIVIIAGALYFGVTEAWEDGAPPATITVRLTEPSTGNQWVGAININDGTIGTISGSRTALRPATITAELIGVEPETKYELEFLVDFQADPGPEAPPGLELFGDVSMIGAGGLPDVFFYNSVTYPSANDPTAEYPNEIDNIQLDMDYKATASFVKADNLHFDKMFSINPPINDKIQGQYIDNSVWATTITTGTSYAGTDAYWGQTTVVLTLTLDQTGNINIVVTDVGVEASEV